ncbi:hypothetical protein [Ideonella azotifigens]|nr:hypothetical protein [Ideonella azotifigens]
MRAKQDHCDQGDLPGRQMQETSSMCRFPDLVATPGSARRFFQAS